MEEKEIEIRSDEVQEILTDVPNWMIRYGITLIFAIILGGLLFTWFIRYPDTVFGEAEITTVVPPITMVAKSSGYIQNLRFAEDEHVNAGQVLAELLNPTNEVTIDSLKRVLLSFDMEKAKVIASSLSRITHLGRAQEEVNTLYNLLIENDELVTDLTFAHTIQTLNEQIDYNRRLAALSEEELKVLKVEIAAAGEKFKADSSLYASGVIAKMTFLANQSEFLNKQQALINARKAAIQYSIIASDLVEQKSQMLKTRRDAERLLTTQIQASLKSLNSFVDEWELAFSLVAPIDGRISYFTNLSNNEFVNSEQPLFAIVPNDERYLAIVHIDQQGYGKIIVGQKVMLKMNNYPFQEFGQLIGRVKSISKVAGERGYVLKVNLTHGLISTYNKEITYQPNMSGTAEIITEDLRLIERIFNFIRKIFDR